MENGQINKDAIILFDGVCNLCNWAVRFIIKHDKKGHFKFGALNSPVSDEFLKDPNLKKFIDENPESVVLIEDQKVYFKSAALIQILSSLKRLKWMAFILRLFPLRLRDWIYDFVAKRRYQWFGKRQSCTIPSPEIHQRFL